MKELYLILRFSYQRYAYYRVIMLGSRGSERCKLSGFVRGIVNQLFARKRYVNLR